MNIAALEQLFSTYDDLVKSALPKADPDPAHLIKVLRCCQAGAASEKTLADRSGLKQPGVSKLRQKLCTAGLLTPTTLGKRGTQYFALTDSGRRLLADLEEALSKVVSDTLEQNSPGQDRQTSEEKSGHPSPAEPLSDEQKRIQRWERVLRRP
jgi:DNA-binding MarR family transcriptional regulator